MADLEIYISETTIEIETISNTDCLVYDLDAGNWTHLANTPADSVCIWTGGTDNHEFFIGTSGGTGFIYQLTTSGGQDDTQETGADVNVHAYVTTGRVDFTDPPGFKQMMWALGEIANGSSSFAPVTLDYEKNSATSFTTGPTICPKVPSQLWAKVRFAPDSGNLRGVRWTFRAYATGGSLSPGNVEIIAFAVGYRALNVPTDDYEV